MLLSNAELSFLCPLYVSSIQASEAHTASVCKKQEKERRNQQAEAVVETKALLSHLASSPPLRDDKGGRGQQTL